MRKKSFFLLIALLFMSHSVLAQEFVEDTSGIGKPVGGEKFPTGLTPVYRGDSPPPSDLAEKFWRGPPQQAVPGALTYEQMTERREQEFARRNFAMEMTLFKYGLAFAIAVFFVLLALFRNRRRIAGAIDRSTVSTLATGLNAGRRVSVSLSRYASRIRDEANKR